jgi:hypothetical protein
MADPATVLSAAINSGLRQVDLTNDVVKLTGDISRLRDDIATQNDKINAVSKNGRSTNVYAPMIITTVYRQTKFDQSRTDITDKEKKTNIDSRLDASLTSAALAGNKVTTKSRQLLPLLFWAGPKSITWKFNQRGTIQQSRSGHISHYWRDDSRDTFFDNPSIEFTFQTGNLIPISDANKTIPTLPPGLVDYYDFFSILDEQKILSNGKPNHVIITYQTLLYPNIVLKGFFEPGVTISVNESAAKPASIEWNATFRVSSTDPKFSSSEDLISSWTTRVTAPKVQSLTDELANKQEALYKAQFEKSKFEAQEQAAADKAEADALAATTTEKQTKNKFIDFVLPPSSQKESVGSTISQSVSQEFANPKYVKKVYNDEFK